MILWCNELVYILSRCADSSPENSFYKCEVIKSIYKTDLMSERFSEESKATLIKCPKTSPLFKNKKK